MLAASDDPPLPVDERELFDEGGAQAELSDLRDPDRHRAIDEWSPFADGQWDREPEYRRQTALHRALLRATDAPLFVSTPELLLDWSPSTLLPIIVEQQRWATDAPVLAVSAPAIIVFALAAPEGLHGLFRRLEQVQPVRHRIKQRQKLGGVAAGEQQQRWRGLGQ